MGALKKLDAINRILRSAGEYPVSTLDGAGINDTLLAVQTLDEQVTFACSEGRYFNEVYSKILPNTDGKILVPDNTIEVDAVDRAVHVTTRGRTPTYLYDIKNRTDVFTQAMEVRMLTLLGFDELPTAVQFEVTDTAARLYQMATVGETNQDQVLLQQQMHSRAISRAADVRQRDGNFMYGHSSNPYNARYQRYPRDINDLRRGY